MSDLVFFFFLLPLFLSLPFLSLFFFSKTLLCYVCAILVRSALNEKETQDIGKMLVALNITFVFSSFVCGIAAIWVLRNKIGLAHLKHRQKAQEAAARRSRFLQRKNIGSSTKVVPTMEGEELQERAKLAWSTME